MKIRISLQPTIEIKPRTSWKVMAVSVLMICSLVFYSAWVLSKFHEYDSALTAAAERTLAIGRDIRAVSIEADKISSDLPSLETSLAAVAAHEVLGRDITFRWGGFFEAVDRCLQPGVSVKSMDARISSGAVNFTISGGGDSLRPVTDSLRCFHDSGNFEAIFLKTNGFGQEKLRPGEGVTVPFVLSATRPGDVAKAAEEGR